MKTNIGTTGITKENSKKEIGKEVIYAVSLEWKNNNNNNKKTLRLSRSENQGLREDSN